LTCVGSLSSHAAVFDQYTIQLEVQRHNTESIAVPTINKAFSKAFSEELHFSRHKAAQFCTLRAVNKNEPL
jgi:hypothetical protein